METETVLPAKLKEIQEALENQNRNKAARLLTEQAKDLPEDTVNRLGLAQLAAAIGETATTRFYATHAVAGDTSSNTALRAATLLTDVGDYTNAIKMATRVVKTAKEFAPGWNVLGTLQAQHGLFEQAKESFEKAIYVQPKNAVHWLELSSFHKFTAKDPLVQEMLSQQPAISSMSDTNYSLLLFAIAKMFDDLGENEKSWQAYTQANELMSPSRVFDEAGNTKSLESVFQSVEQNTFAHLKPSPDASNRSIFVFGNLRSGGTIVQRMLVGHPEVTGGDTTGLFTLSATALKGLSPTDLQEVQSKYENPWRDFAAAYHHMIKSRFGAEGRVVDRTMPQARLMPLIHHVLPKAPLIWVRRNLEDTALSQFKTCFATHARWSFTQESLGKQLAGEEALFEKILPSLGNSVLVVNYEDLVSNPEAERAKIYAHCGLSPVSDAPATHTLTQNPVIGTSVYKLNQPLNTNSIGKSAKYAEGMQTFKNAYNQAKNG